MPRTPFGMDPEARGSRFTLHPALAVYRVEDDMRSESRREKELSKVLLAPFKAKCQPHLMCPIPQRGHWVDLVM